jgi:hypothetical protein
MSTFSRSATSAGVAIRPHVEADDDRVDAAASSTSDSLIAPTPLWMMRIFTRSSLSLVSVSASTSASPARRP